MQIDFHHGVTYIVARLAGFDHQSANVIAYSSQYVDDATNSGVIRFNNGATFYRISSAHKTLDYRNFQELANHRVWIPFHFLPGNNGKKANEVDEGKFIDKLICRPNSYVAQDMIRECIKHRDNLYGLHRLGITMHVYVDTWSHQGFAGVNHHVNAAKKLLDENEKPDKNLMNRLKNYFVNEALPLGHGTVLSNPDKPFLKWGYINGRNEKIMRNNPEDFITAADFMCKAMRRYLLGNADADVLGIPEPDRSLIANMLVNIRDRKAHLRHRQWLNAIALGRFSFSAENVVYIPKGRKSWKYLALGTKKLVDKDDDVFSYHPQFLLSDWKLFHDALQIHRFYIIHELLPKYGICID